MQVECIYIISSTSLSWQNCMWFQLLLLPYLEFASPFGSKGDPKTLGAYLLPVPYGGFDYVCPLFLMGTMYFLLALLSFVPPTESYHSLQWDCKRFLKVCSYYPLTPIFVLSGLYVSLSWIYPLILAASQYTGNRQALFYLT